MKRIGIVLGKGGSPDEGERGALLRLSAEGYHARYVKGTANLKNKWEREDCNVAVSRYHEFLEHYPITELIEGFTPEAAQGIVPSGFPQLPPGYTLHQAGPRFSLRDQHGAQVHDKMLYKGGMTDLIKSLTDGVE